MRPMRKARNTHRDVGEADEAVDARVRVRRRHLEDGGAWSRVLRREISREGENWMRHVLHPSTSQGR